MRMSAALLPEFDHECANTRKTLERIPEHKPGWRPHAKSWTLIELATHLANLPVWTGHTLNADTLDLAPLAGAPPRVTQAQSQEEVLARFDKNVADARATIAATEGAVYFQPWSLLMGGKVVFTMPRIAVLRSFVLNHSIHHRGQLTVYLRLNDVPVPGLYGPSADEAVR